MDKLLDSYIGKQNKEGEHKFSKLCVMRKQVCALSSDTHIDRKGMISNVEQKPETSEEGDGRQKMGEHLAQSIKRRESPEYLV